MASGHMSDEAYRSAKKAVWRITLWLSIITIVEILMALLLADYLPKWALISGMIILSLLKAFFIVGEFMHLKYELRALILSILVPLVLLIWFIISFIMEGEAWRLMRQGIFG